MHTLQVVKTALEQKSLSGIVQLLDVIRQDHRAAGCVVWEANPKSILDPPFPKGSLFVLAQCFEPRRVQASWNLDLSTPIGQAVVLKERYECPDIRGCDPRCAATYPFTLDPTLTGLCAIPLTFPDESRGALALYVRGPYFSPPDVQLIQQTAQFFPSLHQVIRNHVSLTLIDDVTRSLQDAEAESGRPLPPEQMYTKVQTICRNVQQTFGCLETSIYLEDSTTEPGVFKLTASTLDRGLLKPFYRADPKMGLTGWLLHKGSPKRIFDLADLKIIVEEDAEMADLVWCDPLNIRQFAREQLCLTRPDQFTPPLSWMGAPISVGPRVFGAIRCCVSREGPFYFGDRELKLLSIIAAHVGQFWNNWLTRRKMGQENRLWRNVVSQVSDTNRGLQEALSKPVPTVGPSMEVQVWAALGDLVEEAARLAENEAQSTEAPLLPVDSPGKTMQRMLTGQMDLYKGLAETVQGRYKAQTELQQQNERQTQTYLDLAHQLRSPILAAHRRAQQALERGVQDGDVRSSLLKIRGLCAKARTVTMSVKLYADLAKGQNLKARLSRMLPGDLRQLVIECADDTQNSLDSLRELRFDVDKKGDADRRGFDALVNNVAQGDLDLLRQAISNILDNAGKYAKTGSSVLTSVGLTRSGWFHITTYNKPFFRPKDPEKWILRGWRGEEAQDVTAEGSGIGLFIVHEVMSAHNGKLEIIPWNNQGMTEVKLLFPVTGTER